MNTQISLQAMLRTGTALIFAILTHAVTACEWGKYGENCEQRCPPNCQVNPQRNLTHCNKETGECSDGCITGWYDAQCDQHCSKNCLDNVCNHGNGHCTRGCSGNQIGDFCEVTEELTRTDVKVKTDETTGLSTAHVAVIITISLVGIIVIIVVAVVIKRRRQRRTSTGRPTAVTDPENPEVAPLLPRYNVLSHINNQRKDEYAGVMERGMLEWEIQKTEEFFEETAIYNKVKERLENFRHVTISGASGEGKTSMALMLGSEYQKKGAQQSATVQPNDEGVQGDIYSVEYQAINRYWQIRDEDIGIPCVPPAVRQEERGQRLSMPVLAECFSTTGGGTYSDASESSARDTQSYTHISQDVAGSGATQSSAGDTQSYTHISQDVARSGATQSSAGDTQSYTHISQDVAGSGVIQRSAGENQPSTHISQDVSDGESSQSSARDTQSYTHISQDVADSGATQRSAGDNQPSTHISQDVAGSGATQRSAGDNQPSTHISQDVADSGATQRSAGDNQSSTHMPQNVSDGESSQSSAGDARSYTHMSRAMADSDSSHSSASDAQSYTRLLRDVFVDDPKTVVSYISPVHI